MSSIDTRIVEMKFDNAAFERGIQTTLKSLEALQKGLKLDGATAGLEHVNAAASKLSLGNISNGVSTIASRFSAMGIAGVAALASVAAAAVATGISMIKSLTVDPLKSGLQEYETNLNSIQTILANTGLEGKAGLAKVNDALTELNHYSDQTIYNFSEMARNIGTFTAAGIKLEPATAAIKGIANLAAVSGSSSEQASTAMYQLSQAMAAGKATLIDWNSVVNAGMGGKVFQEALKETARVQGVNVDAIIKKNGSFRDSLQEGWLTTKVLTETLSKFTGDLTADQLKSMGYTKAQIVAIQKMGKTAQDAATKVKTVSQLIGTLREAMGSGWAQTWQLLFGNFDEAKTLFTNVNNVLGGFIQNSANARNKVIGDWKALGGRTVLIQTISNAFNALIAVIKPIKDAFREIFPPTTGKQLFALTKGFLEFTKHLKIGADTAANIKRTFAGVFAIFDIGIQVLKGIGTVFGIVFKSLSGGSGGILEFTGNIGDWLVALDKAIKSGTGFHNFFVKLGNIITVPIKFLKQFIGYLKDVVSGIDDVAGAGAEKIAQRFEPLGVVGKVIAKIWSTVIGFFKSAWNTFLPLAGKFSDFIAGLGTSISDGIGNLDYNGILDGINTGLLAGLVLLFKKFLSGGINVDLGGGFLSAIKDSFEGLTGVLSAMQAQLKANALLKIAGAIALLTVSVVALSLIDSAKLASALSGLTIMFTQLLGAMAIMDKISSTKGFIKMPLLTISMIALAIAVDLLAVAVGKMAALDWNGLAKGLVGVGFLLGSLALFTKFASVESGGLKAGAGLILLALAIKLLVSSVSDFSGMKWSEMAKGLTGVAAILVALALFTKFSAANAGGLAQGAGILLLALGLKVIASAMADLGKLSWGEIAKGLTVMAVALTLISLAIGLLPPSSILSAAAIFVTAASLGLIADALGQMGGMSWEEIAKGLIVLAGSLAIIAGALYLMTGTLPGSAALLVATVALKLLAPVLQTFGAMSWEAIGKGLLMLAGVFLVLGVAGLLLAPVVPVILALGIAIGLLGIGMLAAGAGVFLFATGLAALAAAGTAGAAAIIGIVRGLIGTIPYLMEQIGLGVIAFAKVIATAGPAITQAIVTVLVALMNAIDTTAPKIVSTLGRLLELLLAALVKYIPKMVDAGYKILQGVLKGIGDNIAGIVKAATDIIVNFLNALSKNLPRIQQAGADLIIKFVNGTADAIRNNSKAMGEAGGNLASAMIEGMVQGLAGGVGAVVDAAAGVAKSAYEAAKAKLGINSPSKEFHKLGMGSNEGMANGLADYTYLVTRASEGVGQAAIESMRKSISGIADVITTDANFNPVIRPVLDLTNVTTGAAQIGSMLSTTPIAVTTTNAQAKDASAGYNANQVTQEQVAADKAAADISFTQINNSPKALSAAEIYRNTKNQLSVAKGALTP